MKAFSLLELSIVLAIIGLIAGGVVVGASMIRAAELRKVMTDISHVQASVITFKEKYSELPGDSINATDFWGVAGGTGVGAACYSVVVTDGRTCNGNGNGRVGNGLSESEEPFLFWVHLLNADLVGGTYTGVAGPGNAYHMVVGENVFESAGDIGIGALYYQDSLGSAFLFDGVYRNMLIIGATKNDYENSNPVFTGQEAWSLDKKIDDGMPATGEIVGYPYTLCSDALAGESDELDSEYDLAAPNSCALFMRDVF